MKNFLKATKRRDKVYNFYDLCLLLTTFLAFVNTQKYQITDLSEVTESRYKIFHEFVVCVILINYTKAAHTALLSGMRMCIRKQYF